MHYGKLMVLFYANYCRDFASTCASLNSYTAKEGVDKATRCCLDLF